MTSNSPSSVSAGSEPYVQAMRLIWESISKSPALMETSADLNTSGGVEYPTEIARAAVAGFPIVILPGPAFPVAETVVTPADTAVFIAILFGDVSVLLRSQSDELIIFIFSLTLLI